MSKSKLTDRELEAWGGFLRNHFMLRRELERRLLRNHGLHMSSYGVLVRLDWAGDEGVRMSELAEQAMLTSGGLTRLADRLEREGLITRTRSTEDLRGMQARITPDGRKLLREANTEHLSDVRELFLDHLTGDELEMLAQVWARLKVVNEHLTAPGSPGR